MFFMALFMTILYERNLIGHTWNTHVICFAVICIGMIYQSTQNEVKSSLFSKRTTTKVLLANTIGIPPVFVLYKNSIFATVVEDLVFFTFRLGGLSRHKFSCLLLPQWYRKMIHYHNVWISFLSYRGSWDTLSDLLTQGTLIFMLEGTYKYPMLEEVLFDSILRIPETNYDLWLTIVSFIKLNQHVGMWAHDSYLSHHVQFLPLPFMPFLYWCTLCSATLSVHMVTSTLLRLNHMCQLSHIP